MSDTALIEHLDNGTTTLTIISEREDGTTFERVKCLLEKYDMSNVFIRKRKFRLSDEDYSLFIQAIKTKEGFEAINDLKNKKANKLINFYLRTNCELIKTDPNKKKEGHKQGLIEFCKRIAIQPLVGKNRLTSISVSKKEIWDELVKRKIITPKNNK